MSIDNNSLVIDLYKNHKCIHGDFIQTTQYNDNSEFIQKGKFYIKRPNKIRLELFSGNDQIVVYDGECINQYDISLNQLIIKRIDGCYFSFIFLDHNLNKILKVNKYEERDNCVLVSADFLNFDMGFREINLVLLDTFIHRISMVDVFDRVISIDFLNVEFDGLLSDSFFELILPDDVEIINM
ncbi:outer membrane lipoprotein carrier protein [Candidatus Kinetoplastibacterium desouzaii TCC079E]|uniref:Outer membrane lipoprotein carrier protein n=1 Tax=Candidatus Kinetoplastidibacterium desouzai TCC079E TaxID=1208919 RepID=M1LSF8_9PROT|nr:outer membrane lipoprotein carrier protein [Candidatus Kinetoplastibacterium desouzaii TCC079E]